MKPENKFHDTVLRHLIFEFYSIEHPLSDSPTAKEMAEHEQRALDAYTGIWTIEDAIKPVLKTNELYLRCNRTMAVILRALLELKGVSV